jgi:hypothetical protein
MVYTRGLILTLLLVSVPSFGYDGNVSEMERYQSQVKKEARNEALAEQQNYYCTENLKETLGEAIAARDPVTGTIPLYLSWKLEELYKTCSVIKNPSKTTKMLLDVIPQSIKDHARADMQE